MGVDAALYLSNTHMPEAVIYSMVKAHGFDPDGERPDDRNVFSAQRNAKHSDHSFGFWVLHGENESDFIAYMHLTHEGPLGPCLYFSGRSNARVIALFRTVAERFGGILRYNDYDDSAKVFHGIYDGDEEGTTFERQCRLAYGTEAAVVDGEDIEKASYDWDCEEHGEPMAYDRKCGQCRVDEAVALAETFACPTCNKTSH